MEKKKKKKVKCYEVIPNGSEVFAISLVDDPAIESNFIYLSKDKPLQVYLEKNEKQYIIGAVLIPEKPIYRNQDGEEFYIQFSKDSIESIAHEYLYNLNNNNVTKQHEEDITDVSVIESWIVEDNTDRANSKYNLNVPEGTWMVMMKVNNKDIWAQIKAGEVKGYSIESFLQLNEINNKINNMQKEIKQEAIEITDGFWDKIRTIIADALGKPAEDKEVEDTTGEIADAMETKADTPKDSEEKVIEQEDVTDSPIDSPIVEEKVKEVIEDINESASTNEEATANLQEVIDGLQAEIIKKDEEIEMLKKQNTKLSKQPSTKPVTLSKEGGKTSFMDEVQNYYSNR